MSHAHNVVDMDRHFIIDPITRLITNAGSAKTKLMQGDHNSECLSFEIDKVVEGHDMTLCNVVRIHYNNIDRSQGNLNRGLYEVKDLAASSEDDSKVVFTWTISEQATMYAGGLSFLVEFKCVNDDGTVPYRWKSDVNNNISISSGIDNDDYIAEEYADILEQWKAEIDEALAANTEARHEHENKDLLDSMTKGKNGNLYVKVGDANAIHWCAHDGSVIERVETDGTTGDITIYNRIVPNTAIPAEEVKIKQHYKTSELENDSGFITAEDLTGGLTDEQAADLAANTEARHEHSNLKTLEEFYCMASELENGDMTILPDVVGVDRLRFRGIELRYCSDGGVVERVEEIERDDTKYLRLRFNRGDLIVENNVPEFIDIPVNLVTERVEENVGSGLTTNSTGLELELPTGGGEGDGLTPEQLADLAANTKARHEHHNQDGLDTIHMDEWGRLGQSDDPFRMCGDGFVVAGSEPIEGGIRIVLVGTYNSEPEYIDIPVGVTQANMETYVTAAINGSLDEIEAMIDESGVLDE